MISNGNVLLLASASCETIINCICCPSINNIYLHGGVSDDHPSYKKTCVVIKIKPLNPQNDQLSIGLLAQLVEPCTGIAEVMSSTPAQAYVFH